MRLDRLLQMVVMLVNRKRVKAQELAEYFGVSVRTVYRDAETISLAGIPVVTYQGLNGGLGIAEGYRLDRTVMSEEELASVMIALKSVSSSIKDAHSEAVQEKIRAVVPESQASRFKERTDSVRIDFGPWGHRPGLMNDVELLKKAIGDKRKVCFIYCNAKGENEARTVEPYTLVLKNSHWYLYAYCLLRGGFRFFKLSRMRETEVLAEAFLKRDINLDELPWEQEWQKPSSTVPLLLRFPKELRPLLEDWFGVEQIKDCLSDSGFNSTHPSPGSSGFLLVQATFPEDEWLYGYLLSFGSKLEILEPERVRERVRTMAEQVVALYSKPVPKT
jgi:predicted DNA-binding transcriptional regulator YafY